MSSPALLALWVACSPCGDAEALDGACVPASCGDEVYAEGASGVHVDAAAEEEGDGSRDRPFRSLAAALESAPAGVALAAGRYPLERWALSGRDVSITGRCPELSILEPEGGALSIEGAGVSLSSLSVTGRVEVSGPGTLHLDATHIVDAPDAGVAALGPEAVIDATSSRVARGRFVEAGYAGLWAQEGGRLSWRDGLVEACEYPGAVAIDGGVIELSGSHLIGNFLAGVIASGGTAILEDVTIASTEAAYESLDNVGAASWAGGYLEARGLVVSDQPLQGVVAQGHGSRAEVDGAVVSDVWWTSFEDGEDEDQRAVGLGVYDDASLTGDGIDVARARNHGLYVSGAAASVSGLSVSDSFNSHGVERMSVGVLDGADVALSGLEVSGFEGYGVAVADAMLDLLESTIRDGRGTGLFVDDVSPGTEVYLESVGFARIAARSADVLEGEPLGSAAIWGYGPVSIVAEGLTIEDQADKGVRLSQGVIGRFTDLRIEGVTLETVTLQSAPGLIQYQSEVTVEGAEIRSTEGPSIYSVDGALSCMDCALVDGRFAGAVVKGGTLDLEGGRIEGIGQGSVNGGGYAVAVLPGVEELVSSVQSGDAEVALRAVEVGPSERGGVYLRAAEAGQRCDYNASVSVVGGTLAGGEGLQGSAGVLYGDAVVAELGGECGSEQASVSLEDTTVGPAAGAGVYLDNATLSLDGAAGVELAVGVETSGWCDEEPPGVWETLGAVVACSERPWFESPSYSLEVGSEEALER